LLHATPLPWSARALARPALPESGGPPSWLLHALAAVATVAGIVAWPQPASAAPAQPCPIAAGGPTTHPVPTAVPPSHDPSLPVIGGDGLATSGLVLPAGAPPPPGTLTATSWLVADLDSGAVLGACGPHEYRAPASVQKLLLAATLVAKLDPAQVVEVVPEDMDFERGSSAVGLLVGGRYPVSTLWLGLLLSSGNDAAQVLARVGGGPAGVPGTIDAMNALAHQLGAYETHAVTPSGLDGPGQFTSAYDLALIARACFALEDFRKYTATQRADIPPQPPKDPRGFQIQNENRLLYQYPGALGGKTGFTEQSRHTYVGAAERGGRRLVVTLLGAEAVPARGWQQGAALLDWGFALPAGTSVGRLVEPGEAERLFAARKAEPAAGAGSAVLPVRALDTRGVPMAAVVGGVVAVGLLVLVPLTFAWLRRRA
jgi:D-alanyl-D-alanine carboxypeptidase (penicillin-binding protein 5/6)